MKFACLIETLQLTLKINFNKNEGVLRFGGVD